MEMIGKVQRMKLRDQLFDIEISMRMLWSRNTINR